MGVERPSLIGLGFHGVFDNEAEARSNRLFPMQPLTTTKLRAFLEHFKNHGYKFVTPTEIADGLDPDGRYAWLTFDDGYANNRRALHVLREYDTPATFFVATGFVTESKSFWWDVIHRERSRRSVAPSEIVREVYACRKRSRRDIEAAIRSEFGSDALDSFDDTDRPFTEDELRVFAREPLVTIGNHTADHEALPRLPDDEVRKQIRRCQDKLQKLTGQVATAIAYPYGLYDRRTMHLARAEGLRLGVICEPSKNRIPVDDGNAMRIRRYLLCDGGMALEDECLTSRSDFQTVNFARRFRDRFV